MNKIYTFSPFFSCMKFLVSDVLWVLYTSLSEVVPQIFQKTNVVTHLVVPAGWGSCLLRLPIVIFRAGAGAKRQLGVPAL